MTEAHAFAFLTRRMRACNTQYALAEIWGNMNPAYHKTLEQVKDELKMKLERK